MNSDATQPRRVVVTEFGENPVEAVERFLKIEPIAVPVPSALAPGEVLIRIRSAAVSWVDMLMASGQYQHMATPPYTPGIEYSGEVQATGPGVDPARCRAGDAVLVDFMKAGPRSYGDYRHAGGFATHAVVPFEALRPIPAGLSFDQAANLLGAYETAWHCLIARGQLQAGETVLIHGASGVTGLAAVQVAKLLGATVIATGRSDEKLAVVREQGADHVVNLRGDDGGVRCFRDEVKALSGGEGVDVVYDTVGGETSLESLRCMAFGARFLIVGWVSTPDVARGKGQRGAPNANQLPTNIVQMKGLSVLGCPAVITAHRDPQMRERRVAQVLDWAAAGRIRPLVSRAFALDDAKQALLARWNGDIVGGCVLHP